MAPLVLVEFRGSSCEGRFPLITHETRGDAVFFDVCHWETIALRGFARVVFQSFRAWNELELELESVCHRWMTSFLPFLTTLDLYFPCPFACRLHLLS